MDLKGPYAEHVFIPGGQLEVKNCLVSNESHNFLIANLKFRFHTPCSFGNMIENEVKWYTNKNYGFSP